MSEPLRLYKCTTVEHYTFFVVAPDETTARTRVEQQWSDWEYISAKGAVTKIEILAEEGQYPEVPSGNNHDTWLLLGPSP